MSDQRKFLDRVTVTGADDSVSIEDMLAISSEFPFVEWGILLSKSSEGRYRFPSLEWMSKLKEAKKLNPALRLSGHLCGKWVRDLCEGSWAFVEDRPELIEMFDRIQFNFHAIVHKVDVEKLASALKRYPKVQFILQLDDVNNGIYTKLTDMGINVAPLFDLSGGAGVLPESWPESNGFYGYAGGLSHENVDSQLDVIESKAKSNIWIDAERRLRSEDDSLLLLDNVRGYLAKSKPYVAH
jgi:hypothetical protein